MVNDNLNDENLYNINSWGEGYFYINKSGCLQVSKNELTRGVELREIVKEANQSGLELPLLIRFTDILHDRILRLYTAFSEAMLEVDYAGSYKLVYPIKVNQEQCVVKGLLEVPEYNIGLESGSKPELMAVIGLLEGNKGATIICNGYKDRCYIRAALIAQLMGHTVFLIIEKISELDIILSEAKILNVKPLIGIRIRLTTVCAGKWENTGGEKSKFGLNAEQILEVVNRLQAQNSLDCLQLMHCHLGSQIADIRDVRKCMKEVARYYVELHHLGVPIGTVDVGGGLGVDYEGRGANVGCSMNYTLKEYATHIVLELRDVCQEANLAEPNIVSESGRALVAHHAVLVTNITEIEQHGKPYPVPAIDSNESSVVHDIYDTYQVMMDNSPIEIYHYAEHALLDAQSKFKHGIISLSEKAKVERLFATICFEIKGRLDENNPQDAELLVELNKKLSAKVFCNLSFFQSLPDAWAIDQIFPIAPISQLVTKPTMHSVLQDLTCDSDGTIECYTGGSAINSTLLLPAFDSKNPYDLAFFLVGAYQEILGNLHNLFGDTNSLEVKLTDNGSFEISKLIPGDTITNVLNLAHFDTNNLLDSYQRQLASSNLSAENMELYLSELHSIFKQLTYLDGKRVL